MKTSPDIRVVGSAIRVIYRGLRAWKRVPLLNDLTLSRLGLQFVGLAEY